MPYVFDTEPLLAFGLDEPGAMEVQKILQQISENSEDAYITYINMAEIRYIVMRRAGVAKADTFLHYLASQGIDVINVGDVWRRAAYFKQEYSMSLADAFTLSTAEYVDGTLIVGADDDFDDPISKGNVDIARFREEPV